MMRLWNISNYKGELNSSEGRVLLSGCDALDSTLSTVEGRKKEEEGRKETITNSKRKYSSLSEEKQ
jgi:hypothetical protein